MWLEKLGGPGEKPSHHEEPWQVKRYRSRQLDSFTLVKILYGQSPVSCHNQFLLQWYPPFFTIWYLLILDILLNPTSGKVLIATLSQHTKFQQGSTKNSSVIILVELGEKSHIHFLTVYQRSVECHKSTKNQHFRMCTVRYWFYKISVRFPIEFECIWFWIYWDQDLSRTSYFSFLQNLTGVNHTLKTCLKGA